MCLIRSVSLPMFGQDKYMDNSETYSKIESKDYLSCLEIARIYEKKREYNLAIKELKGLISNKIETEEILVRLGRLYREIGESALSEKIFKKAIETKPDNADSCFRNKVHKEFEIYHKKTIIRSKPRSLGIVLTTKCNLKCIMCDFGKDIWDIPKRTLQEIVVWAPYLENISWQGGEVFLSDYFEEVFERLSIYPQLSQSIITNGLLINERWARKLVRSNVELWFSIDGATKKTYEYIRKGGRFEDLIKGIELINKYKKERNNNITSDFKMTTSINVVVMKSNYHELEKFVDFARKYKFDKLRFTPIVGVETQENIFRYKDSEAIKFIEKSMPEALNKAKDYGIILLNWLSAIRDSKEENNCIKLNNYHLISKTREILCYWPWQSLFIDRFGLVRPQCFCLKDIGNVHENSLEEIWNSKPMQLYRQKLIDKTYIDLCNPSCFGENISNECLGIHFI